MRKIIFLDIDGVLNTERWHCQTASNELQDEYGYKFDPVAVTNLSKIIEETGADIVISSSWKFMGLSKMRKMWKDRKLPGNVIGITPNTVSDKFLLNVDLDNMDIMAIRGQEVKEWLMLNKNEITNYKTGYSNFSDSYHSFHNFEGKEVSIFITNFVVKDDKENKKLQWLLRK